mmetsp:Transcript_14989/g.20343  ORF Transcript_14989/g.20343 Transcript_14989/m.20343 type:complete len:87 (-) Transcript_14989:101-361(-)
MTTINSFFLAIFDIAWATNNFFFFGWKSNFCLFFAALLISGLATFHIILLVHSILLLLLVWNGVFNGNWVLHWGGNAYKFFQWVQF